MSHELISRSADLRQLQDEGYEVEVRSNHLLIHSVPYLNSRGVVGRGTLVSDLTLAGDVTTTPYKQIIIAMGEGSKAALSAFDHLIRSSAPVETADAVAA